MGEPRGLTCVALIGAVCAAALTTASPVSAATAHTYYVSATGDDSRGGTTPATAWRTLKPANTRVLAGDTVLLEGGSTFAGPISLDSQDTGVTVGSFGAGRARIAAHGTAGVLGFNVTRVTIRDLDLVGDADAFADQGGVNLYSDQPAGHRLSGVTISHVSARGFKNGIEIGAANPGAGFAHVSISHVTVNGNRDAGLITYGPAFNPSSPSYANADVQILRTTADRNLGNAADTVHNSGNGIVLGSVDGGSILHSTATGNGSLCVAPEGPVGIWAYDSRGIRIAYNHAAGNRTGGKADGDGFDLDQNVSDSYLEHNTSSGNDGAGYLVYAGSNTATTGVTVRWNSSKGDAGKNGWYGGITLAGKVHTVRVAGNTVDTRQSASHAPALAIRSGVTGAKIGKNTLRSAAGYRVIARS